MSNFLKESGTTDKPLFITMGCPVGIGPEIIVRLFNNHLFDHGRIVVVGDYLLLKEVAAEMDSSSVVTRWQTGSPAGKGVIPVLSVSDLGYDKSRWGKPDKKTGKAMARYIEKAVELVLNQQGLGIVTCPISKYSLQLAGYSFPGHTEMLAHLTRTNRFRMMMAGDKLKVILATIHEPLNRVATLLNVDLLADCIEMTILSLCNDFGIAAPRVAVAGLNPHGGENGMFGDEEQRIILPAITKVKSLGNVTGPWPPDTVFYEAVKGKYDAVVALYHDQGLIPFKLLHFDDGVNVTLGLPIVRTSVDHGTAYNIAGSFQADESSLVAAVNMAKQIVFNRQRL